MNDDGSSVVQASDVNTTTTEGNNDRKVKRLYKNGSWASLSEITCCKCGLTQNKQAYKLNRYVCTKCSNEHMRELNKKKLDGRYADLQRKYNSKYESSENGLQTRMEYREKLKLIRSNAEKTRQANPFNRMKKSMSNIMSGVFGVQIKLAPAMQYLGMSPSVFKAWVEYNFLLGMTWDNLGSFWKLELDKSSYRTKPPLTEAERYEAMNWRKWYPVAIGKSTHKKQPQHIVVLNLRRERNAKIFSRIV